MKWVILMVGIGFNAAASVFVKIAMIPPRRFPSINAPRILLENWPFWFGLIFYAVAFILYAGALSRLPLNVAHPILTSGAIATVALLSLIIFGEPFPWTKGAGIVLVLVGVTLISLKSA